MTPTLRINGEPYAEAKPTKPDHPIYGTCAQCAFGLFPKMCIQAVKNAPSVFGGDCETRDVVYVRAGNV